MDGTQETVIERDVVERIVHEALGRQLRITAFLALLLGAFGFLLGHFVAASQSRQAADQLREEIAGLQSQISHLAERTTQQEEQQTHLTVAVTDIEVMRREAGERTQIALKTLARVIQTRREDWLRDLEEYSGGRRYVPPEMVAAAVNRYVDEQLTVLERVLDVTNDNVAAAPPPPVDEAPVGVEHLTDGPLLEHADAVSVAVEDLPPEPGVAAAASSNTTAVSGPVLRKQREASVAEGVEVNEYFAPPRRKGFRFYSRSQPRQIEAVGASEPAAIPLPPF